MVVWEIWPPVTGCEAGRAGLLLHTGHKSVAGSERKEEESNPCPFGPDGFQDRSRATRGHLPKRRRQDLNLRTPVRGSPA